jgi:hypothetical protein
MRTLFPTVGAILVVLFALSVLISEDQTAPSSSAFTIDGQRISDLGEGLMQAILLRHQHQSDFAAANNVKIAEAQKVLKENGFYSGPLDGTMSEWTVDALRSFQQSRRLNVTGRIDSDTAQELGLQATP